MDTYEKKYKDSLEKARYILHTVETAGCAMHKDLLEEIFPELSESESEDERIRKVLITYFKVSVGLGVALNGVGVKDIVAWLEKQKERGPLTKDEEYTLHRIIEYLEDETCPSEWISLLHDIYCLPYKKQKESLHIPETCKENTNSFTDIKNRNIRGCIGMALADVPESRFKAYDVTLKECLAYLEKQKDASKAIEAVERIDKYIDEHLANAHDMKDSNPDKKYYRGWDDALGKMAGILQDVYSGEKQKESLRDFIDNFPYSDEQKEQKPTLNWHTIEQATTKRTDEGDCVTTEKMLIKGLIDDEDYRIIDKDVMVNKNLLCIPVSELNAEEQKSCDNLDSEIKKFFDECIVVHEAEIYGRKEDVIEVENYELTARHFAEWGEKQEKQNDRDKEYTDFTIYHPLKNGEGKYECIPYSFYGSLTSFSEDKDLIDFLRTCFYTEEECEEWIERQKEQKPAEWSEEDEVYLNIIVEDLKELYKKRRAAPDSILGKSQIDNISWFKSLPKRFNLQSKQELSEKDKRILKGILGKIDHDQTYGVSKLEMLSLLYRINPYWKPSEEQMKALKRCVDGWTDDGDGALDSLYNDLKKLM